ncbi:MAG TPA: hypothetical protein VN721_14960 [Flavipsychrobacter sp.]|nr:hypothetical protein [Flavipsychrobacter sp.]
MKKLLFFLVLFYACSVNAQTITSNGSSAINPDFQTNTVRNPTATGGHFEINTPGKKGMEHININYMLSPLPLHDELRFMIGAANPIALSADIMDASGKALITWAPEKPLFRYYCKFDISSFPVGSYHIDVYDANKNKIKTIPFEKI